MVIYSEVQRESRLRKQFGLCNEKADITFLREDLSKSA